MLAGTKNSVDHLVPKSEELLSQTQRQERAITNIHIDLTEKTNAIIKELSQVYIPSITSAITVYFEQIIAIKEARIPS